MPSFSSSSVMDPAARAAAALASFVDSDHRPRLAAPEPATEAAGEDTVGVVVSTADAGGAPPGAPETAPEAAGEDTVAVVGLIADAGGAPPGAPSARTALRCSPRTYATSGCPPPFHAWRPSHHTGASSSRQHPHPPRPRQSRLSSGLRESRRLIRHRRRRCRLRRPRQPR